MNIQELKTIVDYKLPIKIIVINNNGYGIIKQYQDAYFQSNYIGTEFSNIDFCSIARAYGMKAIQITDSDCLPDTVFSENEPILIDVLIDPRQKIYPKVEFGNSLENMYPFVELDFVSQHERLERNGWVPI
jgi:acetolactate synthase-1/2/3 large subunit